jgi:hypothetical protein
VYWLCTRTCTIRCKQGRISLKRRVGRYGLLDKKLSSLRDLSLLRVCRRGPGYPVCCSSAVTDKFHIKWYKDVCSSFLICHYCWKTYLPTHPPTYLSMALQPLWTLASFFCFNLFTQSVGLFGPGISPSQGRYLQIGQHEYRIKAHRHLFSQKTHCVSITKTDRPKTI